MQLVKPDYITDEQYLMNTHDWKMYANSEDPFRFFFKGDEPISGEVLYGSYLLDILSTPSVVTVKVRFGIVQEDDSPGFVLILFGTDEVSERLTPYIRIKPAKSLKELPDPDNGNVPDALAKQWLKNWDNTRNDPNAVNKDYFITHYGFLQGYNYSASEIRSSLFVKKYGEDTNFPNVMIKFVLHEYLSFDADILKPPVKKNTFGLLLQSISGDTNPGLSGQDSVLGFADSANINNLDDGDDDGNGYYDLSAPCPRTC